MTYRKAFTILELLVVIAIIGVLAAVLFPVIMGAKQKSKKVVCLSNLHQCGVALRLYMDDYGTNVPPDTAVARDLLKKQPTCCPNDKEWTKGCTQPFGPPMIGSYAYVRAIPGMEKVPEDKLTHFFNLKSSDFYNNEGVIWMVDVFHSSHGIPAPYYVDKETPVQYSARVSSSRTFMPDNQIRLFDDGHVSMSKPTTIHTGTGAMNIGFAWGTVFELKDGMSNEFQY